MKTVTVNRNELVERIKENRDKHREIFEVALNNYQQVMLEYLEKRIQDIKDGKVIEHAIRLPVPEDHTRDYDRVIEMLTMHLGDEIEIDEDDVAMYVHDDWSWKRNFIANSISYASGAVTPY